MNTVGAQLVGGILPNSGIDFLLGQFRSLLIRCMLRDESIQNAGERGFGDKIT